MRVLDLFSGIGGMSLGLQMGDPQFETVQFVEIDDYCRQVLELRWPGVPVHDDVRTFTARPRGYDLVTAGYPCQPFSQAGKRAGAKDDRHLWPEVSRILAECRPTWFLGENVAGHITMGLDDVLSDLEGQGYAARAFVIPACAVDAPHRRDRVWIVGHASKQSEGGAKQGVNRKGRRSNTATASQAVADANGTRQHTSAGPRQGNGKTRDDTGRRCADVANAEDNGLQRLRNLTETNPAGSRQKQPLGDSDESGVTQPCRWLPEPAVCRVANGVPRRVDRLKGLGNSVVPQVVAMLAKTIIGANQ